MDYGLWTIIFGLMGKLKVQNDRPMCAVVNRPIHTL
jgi:hypothetical protein